MSKAVIFDLDGVIVTTDNCHYQAWKRMADEEGINFDRAINERLRGVSRMESLAIILEESAKPLLEQEKQDLAARKNRYYCEMIRKLTPRDIMPGVMEVLAALKRDGVKVAIGSSSKNASLILRRLELDSYFDAIVDGNDIGNSKPDPEVFLLAAEKMGVTPHDCIVVEDADAGIEAAKAGAMQVLGIGFAANNSKADYRAASLCDPQARLVLTGKL